MPETHNVGIEPPYSVGSNDGLGPLVENAMTFDEWMRWETGGKHCDTDDSVQTRLLRRCWDAASVTTRQGLIEAMGSMLHCPCCGETMGCADDCTFAVDCPAEAENLAVLRELRDENTRLRRAIQWIEDKARARKLEIAPSLYGTGFEFGFWPQCDAKVVNAKTLLDAVEAAQRA